MNELLAKFNYQIWLPQLSEEDKALLDEEEHYNYIDYFKRIHAAPYFSVDFETQATTAILKDAVKFRYNEIVSAQISWREGDRVKNVYVPFRHAVYKFNWADPKAFLQLLFSNPDQRCITHNLPFEYGCTVTEGFCEENPTFSGIEIKCELVDTEIMVWVYDENIRPKLKTMSELLLGWESLTISNLFANEKYGAFPPASVAAYSCQDSYLTLLNYEFFEKNFTPAQRQLYFGLEQHITKMLCEATWNGIGIDLKYLKKIVRLLRSKEKEVENTIYEKLGVSPASPKAIIALFKDSDTGFKSTASDKLDKWLSLYDFTLTQDQKEGLSLLRPYRYIQKYLKTYLFGKKAGLATHIWPDKCVRPKWWQWSVEEGQNKKGKDKDKQRGTVNGRFSCTEPSLNTLIKEPREPDLEEWMNENLPEVKLRKLIIPPPHLKDYVVVTGDGSQIEMRTTASAAQEKKLIDFFNFPQADADLYSMFGSDIFGRKITKKDKLQRQIGKGVVLGANYGAGAKKLAQKIWKYVLKDLYQGNLPKLDKPNKNGVFLPDEELIEREVITHIKKLILNLKESFPGLGTYHKRIEALALKNGGKITTRTGRTRTIPGFKKGHIKGVLQLANAKPQNEAADIIKLAMLELKERVKHFARKVYIAADVHDEIMVFCHIDDAVEVGRILYEVIVSKDWVLEPRVKIDASISMGRSWGEQIDFDPFNEGDIIEKVLAQIKKADEYDPEEVKKVIAKVVGDARPCEQCEYFKAFGHQKVFIEGKISKRPKLVVVGANPGKEEVKQGRIFIGKSGAELREDMRKANLPVDDAVWLNALFCYSPDTEGLSQAEINNCKGYLHQLLEVLQPDAVLCLGGIAQRAVLETTTTAVEPGFASSNTSYAVYCTYHPAGVARDVSLEDTYYSNLAELGEFLNR